jgi:hypothetical protein
MLTDLLSRFADWLKSRPNEQMEPPAQQEDRSSLATLVQLLQENEHSEESSN